MNNKFLQKPPPYFFMVHLLHRLYGVDAPDDIYITGCYSHCMAFSETCSTGGDYFVTETNPLGCITCLTAPTSRPTAVLLW